MPQSVPGWFDHVRCPLILTDADVTTALAVNEESLRLFALAGPAAPCALSTLLGASAAGVVTAMRGPEPQPPRIVEARVAGEARALGLALSRLEDGRHLLTIHDLMAEYRAAEAVGAGGGHPGDHGDAAGRGGDL